MQVSISCSVRRRSSLRLRVRHHLHNLMLRCWMHVTPCDPSRIARQMPLAAVRRGKGMHFAQSRQC